jgi:putative effector of murein hydrolase
MNAEQRHKAGHIVGECLDYDMFLLEFNLYKQATQKQDHAIKTIVKECNVTGSATIDGYNIMVQWFGTPEEISDRLVGRKGVKNVKQD